MRVWVYFGAKALTALRPKFYMWEKCVAGFELVGHRRKNMKMLLKNLTKTTFKQISWQKHVASQG